ncbi:hypothetical protein PoB_005730900 [Plakobranchus ocellatus]|uniref:Uncharacterized protein n=1 Tax=Plakobranchus ocellatus TaxID=259542 RepID=A0AAV4CHX1_9GAST|nr:hypothetical protein PoB_005730900 [Plakobranchus ocellatus]
MSIAGRLYGLSDKSYSSVFLPWLCLQQLRPLLRILSKAPNEQDLEFSIIVPDPDVFVANTFDGIAPTKSW